MAGVCVKDARDRVKVKFSWPQIGGRKDEGEEEED